MDVQETGIQQRRLEAARIESLAKRVGVPLVISAEVARHVSEPLTSLGHHALRGVGAEVEVFTPSPAAASEDGAMRHATPG